MRVILPFERPKPTPRRRQRPRTRHGPMLIGIVRNCFESHISPPNEDQESSLAQDQDSVLELYQDQDLDLDHMFDH